jgi:hypothetical protein
MKTLILVALAALSLGVGAANAAVASHDGTQQRNYGQYGLQGGGG